MASGNVISRSPFPSSPTPDRLCHVPLSFCSVVIKLANWTALLDERLFLFEVFSPSPMATNQTAEDAVQHKMEAMLTYWCTSICRLGCHESLSVPRAILQKFFCWPNAERGLIKVGIVVVIANLERGSPQGCVFLYWLSFLLLAWLALFMLLLRRGPLLFCLNYIWYSNLRTDAY